MLTARGDCKFTQKARHTTPRSVTPHLLQVLNAQAASALAIIVYGNTNDDELLIMSGMAPLCCVMALTCAADPGVKADIASFFIGYSAGVMLKNYLLSNPGLAR